MWIIRNARGEVCGCFTNRPPAGNKIPDGNGGLMDEAPEEVADDSPELAAFRANQQAKIDLAEKRAAAVGAIEEKRLADALADPNAPQAVMDYAEAIRK